MKGDAKMDYSVFLKGRLVLNRVDYVGDSYSHGKLVGERRTPETIRTGTTEKPLEQAWLN